MSVVYTLVMGCDRCDRAEEHWEQYGPSDVPDASVTYRTAEEIYGFTVTTIEGEKRVLCSVCQATEDQRQASGGPEDGG